MDTWTVGASVSFGSAGISFRKAAAKETPQKQTNPSLDAFPELAPLGVEYIFEICKHHWQRSLRQLSGVSGGQRKEKRPAAPKPKAASKCGDNCLTIFVALKNCQLAKSNGMT